MTASSAGPAPALISDGYRAMQQELHRNPDYGKASLEYASLVARVLAERGVRELLDYGAGKGRLGQALHEYLEVLPAIRHYDPAIPQWAAVPKPSECVACIDVLEHIEPALLSNVLDDLKRVTLDVGILTIHTGPAVKVLPDGRNAHLIQQPLRWWLPQILERFDLVALGRGAGGFWVVVEALKTPQSI